MVGQTVSHYRIVERLGGGGMGVVYKAIDLRLNRPVALKFLSPELTRNAEANARFVQEAQAASALDHPNICVIHEIDETTDRELFLTMAYYEGETLKQRIDRGALSVGEAIDIAAQICRALAKAHAAGIVHRDIKPANVMLTSDGVVKVVDFGLAKLAGHSDITRTGTTLGTVAYMSPEQIRGADADARTDVWAIGVVLYEMLAGRRPFGGKDDLAVIASIMHDTPRPVGAVRPDAPPAIGRIVDRALDRSQTSRYGSADDLLADLAGCQAAMSAPEARATDLLRLLRRPVVATVVATVLLGVGVLAAIAYRRSNRARWARNEAVPQIMQLVGKDDYTAAFALASEVDRVLPNDPLVANLWNQFSAVGAIDTTPEGADVFAQPYAATDGPWQYLGRTPLRNRRLPRAAFRFRFEKEGFKTRMAATFNPGSLLQNLGGSRSSSIVLSLSPKDADADMDAIPGGAFPVGLSGFNSDAQVALDPFLIDRHEVTNADYKAFVDKGGYAKSEYWTDGDAARVLPQLRDSTGRPGPATWELGAFPPGQANYPVGGVSWYEAVAYCRSAGKALPTVYHWARAAVSTVEIGSPLAPAIIPLSNIDGRGPKAVGTSPAIGPYGTYDMAGNVREWAWNEWSAGRRWILGGAWNDPPHMFVTPATLPALDRAPVNGFRCVRYDGSKPLSEGLLASVQTYARDNRSAKAVSNEVYEVFRRQYAYESAASNDRVDARDDGNPDWIREVVTFDAGYETRRVSVPLFIPRRATPPYQLVVFFPGLTPFIGRGSSEAVQPGALDFIVNTGRVLAMPTFKGSYERWDPFITLQGDAYMRTFRQRMGQWRQDLGRTLDVLSARHDISRDAVAYMGVSFGASTALPLLALEDRIKTAVLLAPGFTYRELPPEADAINYVSHITMPVLMVGGRHDYVMPLLTAQVPLFERLGTPADRKRHVVTDSGHVNFPRSELIREVLGWLDKYLGPVRGAS